MGMRVGLIIFVCMAGVQACPAQNLHGSWVADTEHFCIQFDTVIHRMAMCISDDDWRTDRVRMEFVQRGQELLLTNFDNQRLLWVERRKTMFSIDELTDSTLALTNATLAMDTSVDHSSPRLDAFIAECFGAGTIRFRRSDRSCLQYYSSRSPRDPPVR